MENLFSIGAVSELLGISKSTLHFYDKIGLVTPKEINRQTGYRYYEYNQLHYIDRIKYLQSFDIPLQDIKVVLQHGNVAELVSCLESQEDTLKEELLQIQSKIENIRWYIEYYNYLSGNEYPEVPFKRTMDKRYALTVPCYPDEPIRASGPIRLAHARCDSGLKSHQFLRQNGFVIDYQSLMNHKMLPLNYFIYLKGKPRGEHPGVQEFPAGEYLCFRGKILTDDWMPDFAKAICQHMPASKLVVADEYEDNLSNFTQCYYEIQILIREAPPAHSQTHGGAENSAPA